MDSIGDYIYLIILIVVGLSGLLKKKKETSTTNSNPTTTKKSWEDVLRDLIPIEEEEVFKTQEVAPQVVVNKAPEPFLNFESSEERIEPLEKSKVSQIVNLSFAKKNADNQQTQEVGNGFLSQIQFNSLDDAKKAFVYSEIFNRKY